MGRFQDAVKEYLMGKRLIQLSQKQERSGGGVKAKGAGWGVSWCNSRRAAERVVFQSGKVLRHRSDPPHLPQASPTPASRSHKSSIKQPLAGDCKGSARNFCLCAAANTTRSSSSSSSLCVERSSSPLLAMVLSWSGLTAEGRTNIRTGVCSMHWAAPCRMLCTEQFECGSALEEALHALPATTTRCHSEIGTIQM